MTWKIGEWRKAKASSTPGGACVEVAPLKTGVGIRDSVHPERGHHTVSPLAFRNFLQLAKDGQFDLK